MLPHITQELKANWSTTVMKQIYRNSWFHEKPIEGSLTGETRWSHWDALSPGLQYSSGCLVRGRTLHCHRIQIPIRRALQRQCHLQYVLSVWLSSGILLVTKGLIGSVCFRVLLWGKVIAFMSAIYAFKKQESCESSFVRKGHLVLFKRFSFHVKNEIQQFAWANNGIAGGSFEGVPACWACSGPPTKQHLSQ